MAAAMSLGTEEADKQGEGLQRSERPSRKIFPRLGWANLCVTKCPALGGHAQNSSAMWHNAETSVVVSGTAAKRDQMCARQLFQDRRHRCQPYQQWRGRWPGEGGVWTLILPRACGILKWLVKSQGM